MKTLKNKTLNKIYMRFMEKQRAYKASILDKILTYTPILNSFKFTDNLEESILLLAGYTVSVFLSLVAIAFSNNKFLHSNTSFTAIWIGIFFILVFYTLSLIVCFNNEKIKKEKHDQEYQSKPLSVEDFNTVIDNVNKRIVSKLLEENNQKITYHDLEKLDELLLKEKETLSKIEYEKMIEILGKIDANDLIKKFKDKNTNEIIDSLKKLGLNFKDTELLVKKENLTSKIVKSEKEKEVLFN